MTAVPFDDDEPGYLEWMANNPAGFVVNVDKKHVSWHYPMLHRASCKTLHVRENYTTGVYYKACADTVADLEQWVREKCKFKLRHCQTCRPGAV